MMVIFVFIPYGKINAKQQNTVIIYFYSPTCSTCEKVSSYIDNLDKKNNSMDIKKYSITNLDNKSLMNKYCEIYKVDSEKIGEVPITFIKDKWLTGEENIKNNLEKILNDDNDNKTIELTNDNETVNFQNDVNKFQSLNWFRAFAVGLVNGINPCSLSMLLFFISLIVNQEINIMKVSLSFCIGKFLSFLLLGTLFFSILSSISVLPIGGVLNGLFIIFLVILSLLSIQDYFATKKEKYEKVRLQLPRFLRKFNHDFMKRGLKKFNNSRWILLLALCIGFVITFGEFMCAGQIFLSSIITVIHKYPALSLNAFLYLVIYDTAYILPLLILSYVVYRGKEVFEVSEKIREYLPKIKLIYSIAFTIFAIILVLNN